jgi:hypothetical protein
VQFRSDGHDIQLSPFFRVKLSSAYYQTVVTWWQGNTHEIILLKYTHEAALPYQVALVVHHNNLLSCRDDHVAGPNIPDWDILPR